MPYVVRAGDTPSEIAQRYILPEHDWRDVMRLAKGRDPRRLPRGRTLSIPVSWLRWKAEEARLASARGNVTVTVNGRQVASTAGTVLGEGARIATAADSFVTLVLTNGSRIALPSQSTVRVARLRRYLINDAISYHFALERGRVETKATPLKDASDNFIINTPIAMTAVRGTEYAVALDPAENATGTGVFEGLVAVSAPDGSATEAIPAGFGAITDDRGGSTKVDLLPAPDLRNPGNIQTHELVAFDIEPIAGARSYHLQLATDVTFVDSYHEQESATPHFEIPDVPNGNQAVRISAIGDGGLRGMRQSYAFLRHLATVGAELARTEEGLVFKWFGTGEGTRHYHLKITRDDPKGTPVVDEVGLETSGVTVRELPPGVYFWSVGATQYDSLGEIEVWTAPEKLTIASPRGD